MAFMRFSVRNNINQAVAKKLAEGSERGEHILANQVMDDTDKYVPALSGTLARTAMAVGNQIIYNGPYARYLYYGKVMVDEHGHGPRHFVDKFGNEVIAFPKGSRLHATDRDLVFTKSMHPDAQAHWFEASKAQNLKKWERIAAEAITDE